MRESSVQVNRFPVRGFWEPNADALIIRRFSRAKASQRPHRRVKARYRFRNGLAENGLFARRLERRRGESRSSKEAAAHTCDRIRGHWSRTSDRPCNPRRIPADTFKCHLSFQRFNSTRVRHHEQDLWGKSIGPTTVLKGSRFQDLECTRNVLGLCSVRRLIAHCLRAVIFNVRVRRCAFALDCHLPYYSGARLRRLRKNSHYPICGSCPAPRTTLRCL
jgi:hypothetical protein